MSIPNLTDWQNGDDIRSRAHHQEPIDALKYILALPNSTVGQVGRNAEGRLGSAIVGTITNTGPAAQADFTNEWHWCQVNYFDGATKDSSDPLTIRNDYSDEEDSEEKNTVPALYVPDVQAHTHSLALGTKVLLFPLWTSDDPNILTRIAVPIDQPGAFPVYVEKTGGSNGNASSTASWTYKVYALNGATMGANVPLATPRPNGTATFQSGTSGLGLACYVPNGTNAAALKLLNAYEIYGVGGCS